MAFTEDLTEFLDEQDGFAVLATLDGSPIKVVLDEEYAESEGISGAVPIAKCLTSDLSTLNEGASLLVIGSDSYIVSFQKPDGTGMSDLVLAKQ